MEPQETKFSFIYNEIKQRILNGQILPGNCLPSSRVLCNQFHVSRYTINCVFNALKKEGLIEIRPRLAPTVLSNAPYGTENILFNTLRKRDSIVQLYQTFALILPSLLVFASENCNLELMLHYKQALKVSRLGIAAGGWRPSSDFIKEILEIGGNSLIGNLYSTFELYHNLSFFTEECPFFLENFLHGSTSVTGIIMDILKGKDPSVKKKQLEKLGQRFADSIANTLNHLVSTTPKCPAKSSASFLWRPTRGKDYFYSRIISDLNQKIGSGEYPYGTFLPHEKQLASQYGVSVFTVRKALDELNQRGLVKSLNGKGTMVIEPDDSLVNQMLPKPRRTQEALQYLHALQLLVLIIHPVALIVAPTFTTKDLDKLDKVFNLPNSIHIIDIFEAILKHIELQPLHAILTETFRLTEWGHYIAYYDNKKTVLEKLNKKVAASVQHLRKGDINAFANGLTDCYRFTLKHAKDYMIKKYKFYRIDYIQIPEIY